MMHLLLQIPTSSIRLAPYITVANYIPVMSSLEAGLSTHPQGKVICLPGVASYVGSDISAGVLSSGMSETEKITLFLDVGTNGEMVLGSKEWLVTCACSAGPAFEGAFSTACGRQQVQLMRSGSTKKPKKQHGE